MPAKPYPDENWFFGSVGSVIDGEWQPSAAEIVAARRKLTELSNSFPEDHSGKRQTPWQLALRNELMRVELKMVNRHYALTIGEHVHGDRTWAPSTRLGIETRWRHAEIALNEAATQRELRRRRHLAALRMLPRFILKRIGQSPAQSQDQAVCGEVEWSVTAPPGSEEYRRKWRPHEFENTGLSQGTQTPPSEQDTARAAD